MFFYIFIDEPFNRLTFILWAISIDLNGEKVEQTKNESVHQINICILSISIDIMNE